MRHHPDYTQNELDALASYALDLLEGDDRVKLEDHLRGGCVDCDLRILEFRSAAADAMAYSVPRVEPPTVLRTRIQALTENRTTSDVQVWKKWDQRSLERPHVVRGGEGDWKEIQAGIFVKKLHVDRERETATMLIRMEPGTSYGRHLHAGSEQCFVLEGDISDGEISVSAGDYQCLPAGTTHERQVTQSGCLLLIVSSLRDELLD